MLERDFQGGMEGVIKEIYRRVPGCIIMKNNANYKQGISDLTIYYKDRYAILEVKQSSKASYRPNQETYLDAFKKYTYARRIEPENKEEVINGLCEFFGV